MARKTEKHAIDIVDAEIGFKIVGRVRSLEASRSLNDSLGSTIHKIPLNIRQNDDFAYDPKILSIGPYHRGKEHLQQANAYKWRYLHELLGSNLEINVRSCVEEIKKLEMRARSCYSESFELSSDEWVEMMVLDGCFIVNFLIKRNSSDSHQQAEDPVSAVHWILPLIWHDFLMLENQIPFFILQAVYDVAVKPQPGGSHSLKEMALNYITRQKTRTEIPREMDNHQVHHLLHLFHLFHRCLLQAARISTPHPGTSRWLPSVFLPRPPGERTPETIPCASALREAGVCFRKKESATFLDVTFEGGKMVIPRFTIGYRTNPVSRNLIAFEQCCPSVGNYFTSYAVLMDDLIDTPKDVAILRRKKIIDNKLGSDEEAAVLYNRILNDITIKAESNHYADLFRRVNAHCGHIPNRWRAKAVRDYFGNPWSIISLLAAIVLLVLAIIQTIYTALSYLRAKS